MLSLEALADPTRRRIVELLAHRGRTAGELVEEFDLSAPAVSQHLKVLREARLVRVEVDGQFRRYSLEPQGFDELERWLERTRSFWSRSLDALERELKTDHATKRKTRS